MPTRPRPRAAHMLHPLQRWRPLLSCENSSHTLSVPQGMIGEPEPCGWSTHRLCPRCDADHPGGTVPRSNVFKVGHMRPGETLLVHGGSSGIGTMAIQLAKALGARVAVTPGSPDKLQACRALGADILINYREHDFVEELRRPPQGTAPTSSSTSSAPSTSTATSTPSTPTAAWSPSACRAAAKPSSTSANS